MASPLHHSLADLLRSSTNDEQLKFSVWSRCAPCNGYDERVWRYDSHGTPINWFQYGDRSADHGWEIDHIVPTARGGPDHYTNKQALHWKNNVQKGAGLIGGLFSLGRQS